MISQNNSVSYIVVFFITGSAGNEDNKGFSMYPKQKFTDGNNLFLDSSLDDDTSMHVDDRSPQLLKSYNPSQNIVHQQTMLKDQIPLKRIPPIGHRDISRLDTSRDSRFGEGLQVVPSKPNKELTFDVDDLDIPWSDLVLKERIGAGNLPSCPAIMWRTQRKSSYVFHALNAVLRSKVL